jgi:DNA-binding transcriptional MerR regulator
MIEREELSNLAAKITEKETKAIEKFTQAVKAKGVSSETIDKIIKSESFAPKLESVNEKVKEKLTQKKLEMSAQKKQKQPNTAVATHDLGNNNGGGGGGGKVDLKHGTKGILMCNGVQTDSEVIYWRNVPGDSTYESPITPHHGEHHDTYVTFRYDMGGWNNIRMGIEIMVVTAHAMGRTLVQTYIYIMLIRLN